MNKSTVIFAALGVLTAVGLSMAQDARADESSYINGVAHYGVTVTPVTLTLGHQICSDISTYGVAGVQADSDAAMAAGVQAHTAAVLVVLAVSELCPSNEPALDAWLHPASGA